ncbi:Plasmodium exported protein, unknown function [Plasmodium vivax]|uniref:Plasmodium RESA N-terminal domain-containing protein n=1 Tax=Plasmodium vivax TaxID=5855 RepID=A0A1G4HG15_PLAVI|nr:Plasmodium exported protein, unknown function [Plasmodium vivax]
MKDKKLESKKISLLLSPTRSCVVSLVVVISLVVLNAFVSKDTAGAPQLSGVQSRILSDHPTNQNEFITNENVQEGAEDSLAEIEDDLYDSPQGNANTAQGESADPLSEITDDLYENPQVNRNTTEEIFQSAYDPTELKEKSYIVFHSFREEDINEIINSVNDNLFKREMLERWIQLHEDAVDKVHTLKEHLSYYLRRLKSLYNVDDNIAEEQMQKSNHTIDSTIRITEEYHNKLFFYYVIKDNLPEYEHERFINICRNTFTLFINELVAMGEGKLNKCVLE